MTREDAKKAKDRLYDVPFDYDGDALIDKIFDEFEEENAWHTGIPTEDGWYLVQFNSKKDLLRAFGTLDLDELLFYMKDEGFVKYATVKVVAWQKIVPHEETKK